MLTQPPPMCHNHLKTGWDVKKKRIILICLVPYCGLFMCTYSTEYNAPRKSRSCSLSRKRKGARSATAYPPRPFPLCPIEDAEPMHRPTGNRYCSLLAIEIVPLDTPLLYPPSPEFTSTMVPRFLQYWRPMHVRIVTLLPGDNPASDSTGITSRVVRQVSRELDETGYRRWSRLSLYKSYASVPFNP